MTSRRNLAIVALASALLAFAGALPNAHAEDWAYVETEFAPRLFGGDEDTRAARVHFVNGDFGLAQQRYLRAVEATPQNSAAWTGLAAAYDRIGRYDLAARAYRQARRHGAVAYVVLNNRGYGYLLRGDRRGALRLFSAALELAPNNPTILNNISIAESGQAYFWDGGGVIFPPDAVP